MCILGHNFSYGEVSRTKEILIIEGTENRKPGSPTELIVNTLSRIESLVNQGLAKGVVQNQVKETVRNMFDYPALSQEALSFIWKKMGARDKKKFIAAFRHLIEVNYIAKAKSYVGDRHKIRFGEEVIQNKKAKVLCFVAQKEVDIQISYVLNKVGSRWKVVDIILDEASLIASYRSQFNQFLSGGQNSLGQLIAKIESMSQKIEQENRART
jgi:phospholipid transport system substrate-binding protein